MRFREFCLRIPGDEFRMRFHDQLTVVAGIGELEREELLNSVIGALAGAMPGTRFVYADELGQEVTVDTADDGSATATLANGAQVPVLGDELRATIDEMVKMVRVDGADLGIRPGDQQIDRHPELRDARQTLDEVTEQLQSALAAQQTAEAMREELGAIDERIRRGEESQARRAYAKVLAQLERVRAEAAVVKGGTQSSSADQLLLKRAQEITELAERFERTLDEIQAAQAEMGDRDPLTDEELAEAASFPDQVPGDLEALSRRHAEAQATVEQLRDQLQERAAASLPEPSHPLVSSLSRFPQDELWTANATAIRTRRSSEAVRLGLSADVQLDDLAEVVAELEDAHREILEATEEAEESKVKKVLALRRISDAEKREQAALERLRLPSYLAFHVRQMELMLDPEARAQVEAAELEHRLAAIAWGELAGDIAPDDVAHLEDEVREYARAIDELGGEAQELDRLRRRLHEDAEPALAAAEREFLAACRPFGIDDTELAVEMVTHQVKLGRTARLQRRLDAARQAEHNAAEALSDALLNVGFSDGDLSARLGAYRWAVERASERTDARESARSAKEVEADLRRLESEADRLRRPEWSNVTAAEAEEPDLETLRQKREATAAAYESTRSLIPDIERLRDRYKAVLRRVEVLESELRDRGMLNDGATDGVEQYLLARLASVRGEQGAPTLPVVLDDPFRTLDPERKAELMELCQRLSDRIQLIYVTDDSDIARWARRHTHDGTLTLMEPEEEQAAV